MRATGSVALLLATLLADYPAAQGGRLPDGREAGPVREPNEPAVKSFDEELSYYKRRIRAKAFHLRAASFR